MNARPQIEAVVVLIALTLRVCTEETAIMGYVVLAVYAMTGRSQAIYAFVISWLFGALNPGIFPTVENGSVWRYLVVAGGISSIVTQRLTTRKRGRDGIIQMTVFLGIFLLVHSLLFSQQQATSLLKAILWASTMTAIVIAWEDLSAGWRYVLVRRVYGTLILVAIVSIPLTVFAEGYYRNDRGFQGVLHHPQTFGIVMALLGAWTISYWLMDRQARWAFAASVLAVVMIVLSGARTGGFALAIGVAVMLVVRSRGHLLALIRHVANARAIVLLVTVVSVVALSGGLLRYIEKGPDGELDRSTATELYVRSRGIVILPMLRNILQDPLVGIGFGVPSSRDDIAAPDGFLGIPTSAPVEKGVMPLAILEEVGVLGLALVCVWLWMGFVRSVRNGPAAVAVIVTTLAVNLGESILFSPGGTGLLFMVAIGSAISGSGSRCRDNVTN